MNGVDEDCPACGEEVGSSGLTCDACWADVPLLLRARLSMPVRVRSARPASYQDALIALLQWCQERRIHFWSVSSWVVDPFAYPKD